MRRYAWLPLLWTVGLTAGCVERRYVINSDPPGALVYVNGNYLGATPVDGYIIYYGKYKFTLVKDGYETLEVVQNYPPPWYEWPGADFLAENVYPFKLRDVRCFHYTMQPLQTVRPDDVKQRAEQLRTRGQGIGVPREPRPAAPPPTAPPPPPPPPDAPTLPPPTPVPGAPAGRPAPGPAGVSGP
jgi:PEGA domain